MIRIPYNTSDAHLRITHELLSNNAGITGQTIFYSVRRLSDGKYWDFTSNNWLTTPADIDDTLTQVDATNMPGLYSKDFDANSGLDVTEEYQVRAWIAAGIYKFDSYGEFYPLILALIDSNANKIVIAKAIKNFDASAFAIGTDSVLDLIRKYMFIRDVTARHGNQKPSTILVGTGANQKTVTTTLDGNGNLDTEGLS